MVTINRKRVLALVMSVCMIISLIFPDSLTAKAETNDTGSTATLVFIEPDWEKGCELPASLNGDKQTDGIEGSTLRKYIGTMEGEEFTPITDFKELQISPEISIKPSVLDDETSKDGLYDIHLNKVGTATISSSGNENLGSLEVSVTENRIRLYEDASCREELIRDEWGNYQWTDENYSGLTEAYLKIVPHEDETLKDEIKVSYRDESKEGEDKSVYLEPDKDGTMSHQGVTFTKATADQDAASAYDYKITRNNRNRNMSYQIHIYQEEEPVEEAPTEAEPIEVQCTDIHFANQVSGLGLYVKTGLWFDGDNIQGEDYNAYSKDGGSDLNGCIASFVVDDTPNDPQNDSVPVLVNPEEVEVYKAITNQNGEVLINDEDGTYQTEEQPLSGIISRVDQEGFESYCNLAFPEDGAYVFRYSPENPTEDMKINPASYEVFITVTMPTVGLYTDPEISVQNYIRDDYNFGGENDTNTFYLLVNKEEEKNLDKHTLKVTCDGVGDVSAVDYYLEYEDITASCPDYASAYKISLKASSKRSFRLGIHSELRYNNNEQPEDNYQEVYCTYRGEDAINHPDSNIVQKYVGEDEDENGNGIGWIGYSGCFISEASYAMGSTWFTGAYPDDIAYWVHGESIQEVVDKLLEVADTEVKVYLTKEYEDYLSNGKEEDKAILEAEQNGTTKLIKNTGYIHLNMSYYDSVKYKDKVEAEQYVYAPASIKGIFMSPSSNVYVIKDTMEDVLEISLTEKANSVADDNIPSGTLYNLDGTKVQNSDGSANSIDSLIHGVLLNTDDEEALKERFGEDGPKKIAAIKGLKKYVIEKTVYDKETDTWSKAKQFYAINDTDISIPEGMVKSNETDPSIWYCSTPHKDIHKWPTLHVNASTKVRVSGLWTENAKLYLGFFEDVDIVNAYVDNGVGSITAFNKQAIGTPPINIPCYLPDDYSYYDVEKGCVQTFKSKDNPTSVEVHVVKAESNTNVTDTYCEGDQKAQIMVDEEAVSDFVPLTEEEKKSIIDGESLDVDLSLSEAEDDASGISDIDEFAKQENSNEKTLDYINIDMDYKVKGNNGQGQSKKITQTNEMIVICIPLKESMKNKKNIFVYRYHDGGVEKCKAWIEDGNLYFETDKFSLYAIAASDTVVENHTCVWDEGVITKAPTCTETGTKTCSCTVTDCDKHKVEVLKELSHDMTKVVTAKVEATCHSEGKEAVIGCSRCDHTTGGEAIAMTAHTWDAGVITKVPTCSAKGEKTYTCTVEGCTGKKTEEIVVDSTNHANTEVKNQKAATCTEKGYTGDTYCKDCGSLLAQGQETAALSHDMTKEVSAKVDSTCHSEGKEAVMGCSRCDYTMGGEVIEKKEHTWSEGEVTKEATCTQKGEKTFTCTADGCTMTKVEETEIDPDHHTGEVYKKGVKVATCTTDGYTGDICCKDCDAVITKGKVVKATGHTKIIKNKKDATYLELGYTGDVYCKICNKKLSSGKSIAMLKAKTQKITIRKYTSKISKKKLNTKKVKVILRAKAKGKLSYKLIKGSTRYVKVSKTGVVTFYKGAKKGTYHVKITAARTSNGEYKSATRTIKFTVK